MIAVPQIGALFRAAGVPELPVRVVQDGSVSSAGLVVLGSDPVEVRVSTRLAGASTDAVMGAVGHEVAHLALGHAATEWRRRQWLRGVAGGAACAALITVNLGVPIVPAFAVLAGVLLVAVLAGRVIDRREELAADVLGASLTGPGPALAALQFGEEEIGEPPWWHRPLDRHPPVERRRRAIAGRQ